MTLDWHTSDYPELRPRAPWVMEEMIRLQATLPDGIAGLDAARTIHQAAAQALAAGEEITVVGCGTSEHAAMAVASLLADGLATSRQDARRIRSRQALDAALDPPSSGLMIGVSHDGGTRATQLALDYARRAGAAPRPITARPDSDVATVADHVLTTPVHDRSWCHTAGVHQRHPGRRRDRVRRRERHGRLPRTAALERRPLGRRRADGRAAPLPGSSGC